KTVLSVSGGTVADNHQKGAIHDRPPGPRTHSPVAPGHRGLAEPLRPTVRRNHTDRQQNLAGQTPRLAAASSGRGRLIRTGTPAGRGLGHRGRSPLAPTAACPRQWLARAPE